MKVFLLYGLNFTPFKTNFLLFLQNILKGGATPNP